jgi:hypothetical protein
MCGFDVADAHGFSLLQNERMQNSSTKIIGAFDYFASFARLSVLAGTNFMLYYPTAYSENN